MVLEKTLESPLDCKEIQPVHSEGDQPWDFLTRVVWPIQGGKERQEKTNAWLGFTARLGSAARGLHLSQESGAARAEGRSRCFQGGEASMSLWFLPTISKTA